MKSYIPTINISSLIKNNFNTKKANQTIKQIEKACVNVGFFQITGHGINLKEIKKTCNVGNKFFNSSLTFSFFYLFYCLISFFCIKIVFD